MSTVTISKQLKQDVELHCTFFYMCGKHKATKVTIRQSLSDSIPLKQWLSTINMHSNIGSLGGHIMFIIMVKMP